MKILVIESMGMVGHVMTLYFKEHGYEVDCYNDRYDEASLKTAIDNSHPDAIINCDAVVNQYAEQDKVKALRVNALLPQMLASLTEGTKTMIVQRSTDCIFSGKRGNYTLEDEPDATSYYARSKVLGEIVNDKDITMRVSLIGPETKANGEGLFNWFYNQNETKGYVNAIWSGITTIEFARIIEKLICKHAHGLFQLCPPDGSTNKYDLLLLFEKYAPCGRIIERFENEFVDKSLVPIENGYNLCIASYEDQIKDMMVWIKNHKDIYKHYKKII